MNIIKRIATVAAVGALSALSLSVTPASAVTTYEGDACSSNGNRYCFAIHFNSRGGQTWYSASPCFVSDGDIPDYFGYSPNGATLVRYVFRPGQISGTVAACTMTNEGSGQAVKNNAASASNGECVADYRVYFNSGYSGPSQSFAPNCGDYWPAENLVSGLYNENASHDRY